MLHVVCAYTSIDIYNITEHTLFFSHLRFSAGVQNTADFGDVI